MNPFFNPVCPIESLATETAFGVSVDVLRLDRLHPVVSGNKWFKLNYYLTEALTAQKIILTFGGAFSNHIVATANAASNAGIKSIGVIRGEEPSTPSPTLVQAKAFGMDLYYSSRSAYKTKQLPAEIGERYAPEDLYVIPEGGYGTPGMMGARDILLQNNTSGYTHILSAAGTGTTLAGLVAAASANQKVIGISVLKNNFSLQNEIDHLLPTDRKGQFTLLHDYHVGGYARRSAELFRFMNDFYAETGIPTDFVYTGKAFLAAFALLRKNYFGQGANVLLVHTGGLQGNRSLPKGTLIFGVE